MKKLTKYALLLAAMVMGFAFTSCQQDSGDDTTYYAVSFNSNGGTEVKRQKIESGKKATKPANPTKQAIATETYAFENWYTSTDNGTTLSDTAFDFNTPITKDITLYAKWAVNAVTHTVSFDTNGGSDVASQTIVHGNKATKPAAPTKQETATEAFAFDNWYTSTDGGATLSDAAFDFDTAITKDITLYAKWAVNAVTHTVSFDTNGGSDVASQTIVHGNKATKPADPTKKEGKTSFAFLGWYNGDTAFDFASEIKGEITLKAKWLEGFVKVTGTTIKGDETWTPTSDVFVSGRSLTIGDLYASDHEVTRGEFKAIMGEDPSTNDAYDKDGNKLTEEAVLNNPVNYVNWYDAIVYCNKLSIKEGLAPAYTVSGISDWENLAYSAIPTSSDSDWNAATCNFEASGYRLPTEAEWEWLARGGENYTFAGSDNQREVAWYIDNIYNKTGSRDVKTKAANGYGLYDMSGNLYEWCWDWYNKNVNSDMGASGASSGNSRVKRGGAWYCSYTGCKVAFRESGIPHYRGSSDYGGLGFRVVRNAN